MRKSIPKLLFCTALLISFIHQAQELTKETPSIIAAEGAYEVGHMLLDLVDENRKEPATDDPLDLRQVPIQIWYPAIKGSSSQKAHYRPRIEDFRSQWGDESVDYIKSVSTSYFENSKVSREKAFGVFIFSHGWGARSSSHSTFLSNLASYGYIVIGMNHPYMGKVALTNGTVTEPNDNHFENQAAANKFYAEDVVFVMDQLALLNKEESNSPLSGTLALDQLIAGGHSSGFPAVSYAAVIDNRIKGLISFDSGVPKIVRNEGLDIPIFLFRAEKDSYTDLFFRGKNVHPKGTIYDVDFFRVHRGDFYDFVIANTTHSTIYDQYIFTEVKEEQELSKQNHRLIIKWTVAFHKKVLENKNNGLFENKDLIQGTTLRTIASFQ